MQLGTPGGVRVAAVVCLLAVVGAGCAAPSTVVRPAPSATLSPTATPTLAGTVLPGSGVVVQRNLSYGTDGPTALLLDAYVPPSAGHPRAAIICVHGGGWVSGSKQDWAPYAVGLAAQGWVVFSIDYRLDAPSPFPAEVNDVATAIRWVRDHAAPFGVDPAHIGLLGSSAGGNLAALAAMKGSGPWTMGERVSAVVSWSGPMDLTTIQQQGLAAQTGSCTPAYCDPNVDLAVNLVTQYIGCSRDACPNTYAQASPTYFVDRTDPPMLVVNSVDEIIPVAQAQEMASRLQAVGVPYQLLIGAGTSHGIQAGTYAYPATIQFLQKYLPVS